MDPVTIATIASGAITALAPFFKRGGEKLADKIAEEGFAERGKIWETVKGLFVDEDLTTLKLFEENPENVETQAELRGELKHLLKAKPEVAKELEELLKTLPVSQVNQSSINIIGNDNTAIKDVSGSTININR